MMRIPNFLRQFIGLCAITALLALCASAQSLGELARKQREQKAKQTQTKATKTYTNDDLPKTGGLSTTDQSKAADATATDKQGKTGKEGDADKADADADAKPADAAKKPDPTATKAEEEAAWRDRFKKLRATVAEEERRLDLLQRELNLANVQFYSNPDQAMREQTQRTEINNKTKEIEQQKAVVETARKAITDAEEDLHKKGLPPGWAR